MHQHRIHHVIEIETDARHVDLQLAGGLDGDVEIARRLLLPLRPLAGSTPFEPDPPAILIVALAVDERGIPAFRVLVRRREGERLRLELPALLVLDFELDEGDLVLVPLREGARLEGEGLEEVVVEIDDPHELRHVLHLGEERLQRALRCDLVFDGRVDLHRLLEVGHVDLGLPLQPVDFVAVFRQILVGPLLHRLAFLVRETRGQERLHRARRLLHEHLLRVGVRDAAHVDLHGHESRLDRRRHHVLGRKVIVGAVVVLVEELLHGMVETRGIELHVHRGRRQLGEHRELVGDLDRREIRGAVTVSADERLLHERRAVRCEIDAERGDVVAHQRCSAARESCCSRDPWRTPCSSSPCPISTAARRSGPSVQARW